MKLNYDTIDKIAHLARLEVAEPEKEALLDDMNKILSFMEKLNEIDTEGVEPLIYMSRLGKQDCAAENILRIDEISRQNTVAEALQNSPKADNGYFRVAKVIKGN